MRATSSSVHARCWSGAISMKVAGVSRARRSSATASVFAMIRPIASGDARARTTSRSANETACGRRTMFNRRDAFSNTARDSGRSQTSHQALCLATGKRSGASV